MDSVAQPTKRAIKLAGSAVVATGGMKRAQAACQSGVTGLAGESGTLESSRVLVNERLPQKVRLFKFLEGAFYFPSRYLINCGVITLEIADRTQ